MSTAPARLVVGAVIVHSGRLLAGRRVAPASLAGRWELPGGKVEPGETPADAVVRECAEELGVTVHVLRQLGDDVPVLDGWRMRLFETRLLEGEPQPRADHDALRWLGPDELNEVDWLPADRPLLPALRELLSGGLRPPTGGRSPG